MVSLSFKYLLVWLSFLQVSFFHVKACSDILLNQTDSMPLISGRTMDFDIVLETVLEVIPRGTLFHELPISNCPECKDYSWKSKYGFVGMNILGLNVAADGLNEKGLSAAWLYLVGTEYPTPQANSSMKEYDPNVPIITGVCSYLLGNFASVEEVRQGLKYFQIAEFDERIEIPLLNGDKSLGRIPLHVNVRDAHGKNLVLEFIHKETRVYDNLNQVLTNEPSLDLQLENLEEFNGTKIPGGYGSKSRFVRLSMLNRLAKQGYQVPNLVTNETISSKEQQALSNVMHLINTVVLPPIGGDATLWSIYRDHTNRKLYIQSTMNQVPRLVDLNKLDFNSLQSRRLIPVHHSADDWFLDMTPKLLTPQNTLKTMDLPPREEIEKLLTKMGLPNTSTVFQPSPSPKSAATPSATPASSSSPFATPSTSTSSTSKSITWESPYWVFFYGALFGAFATLVSTSILHFIRMRTRRQGYTPVHSRV